MAFDLLHEGVQAARVRCAAGPGIPAVSWQGLTEVTGHALALHGADCPPTKRLGGLLSLSFM